MKYLITLLIVVLLAVFLVPAFCGDGKTSLKGCDGLNDPPEIILPGEDDEEAPPAESSYTFEFTKKDSFYYPTLKGTIVSTEFPETLVFSYNGEEREITGKAISFNKTSQKYITKIEQVFLYGNIEAGNQSAGIFMNRDGEKISVAKISTITCPEDLFLINGFNQSTGKTFSAMDAEDNWTENY